MRQSSSFLYQKGICNHIENDKLLKEKYGHFSRRQKIEIYFPYNTFVSYILNKEISFFQEYIEMELKIFFITSEGLYRPLLHANK